MRRPLYQYEQFCKNDLLDVNFGGLNIVIDESDLIYCLLRGDRTRDI